MVGGDGPGAAASSCVKGVFFLVSVSAAASGILRLTVGSLSCVTEKLGRVGGLTLL